MESGLWFMEGFSFLMGDSRACNWFFDINEPGKKSDFKGEKKIIVLEK